MRHRLQVPMPQIKANALTIKSKLKERGSYTVAGHPGLHLASRGDGTGSWRVKYRPHGAKSQRWHTISNEAKNADFDDVVRVKDQWLSKVKYDHVDPKVELAAKAKAKAAVDAAERLTLGTVINEWIAKPRDKNLRPRTVALYRWIFDAYVVPEFGARPIAEITKAELHTHFSAVRDRLIKSGGRGGQGTRGEMAGKAFTYTTAVFEYATDQEYIARNPMRGMQRPVPKEPDQKTSRPLRPAELRAVWRGADVHLSPSFARMIKLALLLGRRRAEISEAERGELHLDGDAPHWLIKPREGNKSALPSLVPLPQHAAAIFKAALLDAGESKFVFPQSRGDSDKPTSPDSMSHAWRDLGNSTVVPQEVTLHSARALVTDSLELMGVPDNIVSHVLHHTSDMKSTTAKRAYSTNSFRAEKLRALRLWQARLINIVSGKKLHVLQWQAPQRRNHGRDGHW